MSEKQKKCMVCGKPVALLKGAICELCQDRIRREALGEQAGIKEQAERELTRQGINPEKK